MFMDRCALGFYEYVCVVSFFLNLTSQTHVILTEIGLAFTNQNLKKCFANNASNTKTLHVTSYMKTSAVSMVSRIKTSKRHLAASTAFRS